MQLEFVIKILIYKFIEKYNFVIKYLKHKNTQKVNQEIKNIINKVAEYEYELSERDED